MLQTPIETQALRRSSHIAPLTPQRQARLAAQVSAEEMARVLGVNRVYYSLFERGLMCLPENVEARFWELLKPSVKV